MKTKKILKKSQKKSFNKIFEKVLKNFKLNTIASRLVVTSLDQTKFLTNNFFGFVFEENKPRCYSVQLEHFSFFPKLFKRFFERLILKILLRDFFERFFLLSKLGSVWFDLVVY